MKFEIEQYSDIGDKETNEDSQDFYIDKGNFFALVADGVGSHGRGDEASKTAVEVLKKFLIDNMQGISEEMIRQALEKANMEIISKQSKSSEMKTTICVVAYFNNDLYFAHLGDSRIYLFKDGEISHISRDHSVARFHYDIGEISFEEIRGHIDRNRVTKALGGDDEISPTIKKIENVSLTNGDAILICTDGFWAEVLEDEMTIALSKTDSAKQWLENMAEIAKNKESKDKDNLTATAIRFFN